jgi:hypothetical protein
MLLSFLFFPKIPFKFNNFIFREEITLTPPFISKYILSQTVIKVNDLTYIILLSIEKKLKLREILHKKRRKCALRPLLLKKDLTKWVLYCIIM